MKGSPLHRSENASSPEAVGGDWKRRSDLSMDPDWDEVGGNFPSILSDLFAD